MNTSKRSYDGVLSAPSLQVDGTVPVHMFTAVENAQGAVLCNAEARLVVLNLKAADDVELAVELLDVALNEMDAIGTSTLIYDTRSNLQVVGARGDLTVQERSLRSASVTCLAMLVAAESPNDEAPSIRRILAETKVEVVRAQVFADLVSVLRVGNPVLAEACAVGARGVDFVANYGGSVFSVPELNATVIRTSGNGASCEYFQEIFQEALKLHRRNKTSTLILDTSDSSLVSDAIQHRALHEAIIAPIATIGLASTLVHVRLDEGDARREGIPFETACAKWDIFGCEARTLEEAYALVRVFKGYVGKSVPASTRFAIAAR